MQRLSAKILREAYRGASGLLQIQVRHFRSTLVYHAELDSWALASTPAEKEGRNSLLSAGYFQSAFDVELFAA